MENYGLQQMVSLHTVCAMYEWKYDTLWKKFKRGEFVQGYRNPTGRGLRFNLKDVQAWAHQEPIKLDAPSLLSSRL